MHKINKISIETFKIFNKTSLIKIKRHFKFNNLVDFNKSKKIFKFNKLIFKKIKLIKYNKIKKINIGCKS